MHLPTLARNRSAAAKEIPGIIVITIATIIFCAVAPSHILGGDNAEFVNLSRAGGIAHPPGYPVYTFLLRSFHWLSNSAPRATALVTAILSGFQLCLLYASCRLWKLKPVYSATATWIYSISPLSILLSAQAEVFALNNLLACGILLISSPGMPLKGKGRASAAGALLGIGLAHHHTIVLMSPLIIYALLQGLREVDGEKKISLVVLSLIFFLGGFSANLGLLYWPNDWVTTTSSWPKLESSDDLIRHFFRSQYGVFQLSPYTSSANNLNALSFFGYSLLTTWNIFTPFILISFFCIARRKSWTLREKMWWPTLFSCFLLSGPLFIGTTGLRPILIHGSVIERFYFLPTLLLAPFCALGFHQAHGWILSFYEKHDKNSQLASFPVKIISLLSISLAGTILAAASIRATKPSRSNYLESFLINSIAFLPHQSAVISLGDSQYFGYPYIQEVLRLREDILILSADQIKNPRTHKTLKKQLKTFDINVELPIDAGKLVSLLSKSGRPVFVANQRNSPILYPFLENAKTYPYGTLIRVVNARELMPDAREVFFLNQQLFSKYNLEEAKASLLDGWRIAPAITYQRSWVSIANLLNASGEKELAHTAMNYAKLFSLCTNSKCLGESVGGESFVHPVNNF